MRAFTHRTSSPALAPTLTLALGLTLSLPARAEAPEPDARHPLVAWAVDNFKHWRSRVEPLVLASFHPSVSVGRAGRGRLLFATRLEPWDGVHVRNPDEVWTVPEVIIGLQAAHAAVEAKHPGGPDMVIGDISRRNGGRFPPHRSHQDGLDVDMRYFLLGEQPADYKYRMVTHRNFDTARVWTLIEHLYEGGHVDRIFVDYRHQRRLYRYAVKQLRKTPAELAPILSYPKGRYRPDALVRHVRGHHNHIHIRFEAPIARALGRLWTYGEALAFQRQLDLRIRGQFDYVVRRGDTLSGIAARNEVTVADLRAWNRLPRRSVLRPGKVLRVMRTN